MQRKIYQVEEKVPLLMGLPLSLQHLFAMFGASVLVPFLFNNAARADYVSRVLQTTMDKLTPEQLAQVNAITVIDPALVLLMNGIGTLLYLFLCKGKSPAFLGSSFAYLAPAFAIITSSTDYQVNFSKALGGFVVSGALFCLVAILIRFVGTKWIDIVLPPAAMGPIVALIGLELAGTAASNAGLLPDGNGQFYWPNVVIALFTLVVVILGTLTFRKFLAAIPVLVAVIAGYVLAAILNVSHPGIINFDAVASESWARLPVFTSPTFDLNAILIILPATLVVISEHIGHLIVTSKIVDRDLIKDPGLTRSMLGDGLSTAISGLAGSCPTTTYGENMGVMAITRVYSVWVIGGAAVISIIMAFIGKLTGIINSIPGAVMGGISILLFGVIAASGIRMIVESKVDYSKSKNLILTAVIFIVGLSGMSIRLGEVSLTGMALAAVVGIVMSLVFYVLEKLKLINDTEE
ncbi:MAG TPA: uracil permease [Thermoclostridium caenicola]|uniref:uracil permease n=1 Tax=Thermoclostridium caenicola TaxID=659425 RepID=UPI002BC8BBA3|nr:uracil permease [Thermoclostridium caenicola]HOL83773.1 uracil permease [Thermoclostridium caenicola]HPO75979.1 uracil permease [Thermoclostridium caenicola]